MKENYGIGYVGAGGAASVVMALAVAASVLLAGCGGQDGPAETTLAFLKEMQAGKGGNVGRYCTKTTADTFSAMTQLATKVWDESTTFKAEECKESAEVFIRFGGKGMNTNDLERFVLVKKDGAWKVNCGFGVIGREPDELAEIAAKQGRALFVEMLKADMEREAVGLGSLWPHSKDNLSDDKDDIAGNSFATADAYFDALFDVHAKGQSSPYVKGNVKEMTEIFGEGKGCGWLVAVDVTDESPDTMPMLVSANVNPADLKNDKSGNVAIGVKAGRPRTSWGDDFVAVVRKGGKADVIPAEKVSLASIYGGDTSVLCEFLNVAK